MRPYTTPALLAMATFALAFGAGWMAGEGLYLVGAAFGGTAIGTALICAEKYLDTREDLKVQKPRSPFNP